MIGNLVAFCVLLMLIGIMPLSQRKGVGAESLEDPLLSASAHEAFIRIIAL